MCGIAGVINFHPINLKSLMGQLRHRGPDAQCIYTKNNVALIHTRLAIQDIHHGAQPFHYENFSIVFNGEIYNHLELRKSLKEFNFKTLSDTETLLYLYVKFQYEMFEMLDGMFAFCIYDAANNCLVLARDRAGKKPLYYHKVQDKFIFASELNALKSVSHFNISRDSINCFIRMGFVPGEKTVYDQVFELNAGSYMLVDSASLHYSINKYFDILAYYEKPKLDLRINEATDLLESKLILSVKDRVTASDVEVGAFLSGGIDSGLVVSIASKFKPRLKTFTVKFDGIYDESPLAKLVANRYETEHSELEIKIDLPQDIEKILLSYGEPFMDSSAIPSFYVSQAAKKYVNVVLNGDGADELFGGYRRYILAQNGLLNFLKYFLFILRFLPKPNNKTSIYNYLNRTITSLNKTGFEYYLSATVDIYEDVFQFDSKSKIVSQVVDLIDLINLNKKLDNLSKMMYLDFNLILFSNLLVKMDIATMANSLEARSPFLSKYLLEFSPILPSQYKIRGITTKYLLRNLAKRYLPEALISQPKRGFEVPLKDWVNNTLRENIHDRLSAGCYSESYFSRKFIQEILNGSRAISQEKRAKILWNLYSLEVWYASL